MSTKTRATIEDLYKVEGKAELVNGEIVHMPPTGDDPSRASLAVALQLHRYARQAGRGRVHSDGVGFHVNLPPRESFSPDAAYHVGPPMGMRFTSLAVEPIRAGCGYQVVPCLPSQRYSVSACRICGDINSKPAVIPRLMRASCAASEKIITARRRGSEIAAWHCWRRMHAAIVV